MPYKIGVFGSAVDDVPETIQKAQALGESLGQIGCTVITGASTGLPYEAAHTAHAHGAKIWGFSKGLNQAAQQQFTPTHDLTMYEKLVYIPRDYEFAQNELVCMKYRNVTSTATCDAGIIIAGRWGTMNEFTNLYDMGKVIGILAGSGGIADELPELSKKISKQSKAIILFHESPKTLVEMVVKILGEQKK